MNKPVLALTVSQHFTKVFPRIRDIVGTLVLRDVAGLSLVAGIAIRKVYHTNGLVNVQFINEMTSELLSNLNKNNVDHMSFDLGPSCLDVELNPDDNNCYRPSKTSKVLDRDEIFKIIKERVENIRKGFNGTIALENLDYHKGGAYEHVCSPDFITEIVRKLNVNFVFDIGHALVTCFILGIDPHQYISGLPLDAISEIHISHAQGDNDMHGCPTEYEYELLRYLLSRCNLEFIVLEYYGDSQRIIDENIRLNNFLSKNCSQYEVKLGGKK